MLISLIFVYVYNKTNIMKHTFTCTLFLFAIMLFAQTAQQMRYVWKMFINTHVIRN